MVDEPDTTEQMEEEANESIVITFAADLDTFSFLVAVGWSFDFRLLLSFSSLDSFGSLGSPTP